MPWRLHLGESGSLRIHLVCRAKAGCAVGSTSYSFDEYDLPYILLMCAASWWAPERVVEDEEADQDEGGAEVLVSRSSAG